MFRVASNKKIPRDICLLILSQLGPIDLLMCRLVSCAWNETASENVVWRRHINEDTLPKCYRDCFFRHYIMSNFVGLQTFGLDVTQYLLSKRGRKVFAEMVQLGHSFLGTGQLVVNKKENSLIMTWPSWKRTLELRPDHVHFVSNNRVHSLESFVLPYLLHQSCK